MDLHEIRQELKRHNVYELPLRVTIMSNIISNPKHKGYHVYSKVHMLNYSKKIKISLTRGICLI